jgi:hypothetical protein
MLPYEFCLFYISSFFKLISECTFLARHSTRQSKSERSRAETKFLNKEPNRLSHKLKKFFWLMYLFYNMCISFSVMFTLPDPQPSPSHPDLTVMTLTLPSPHCSELPQPSNSRASTILRTSPAQDGLCPGNRTHVWYKGFDRPRYRGVAQVRQSSATYIMRPTESGIHHPGLFHN